jgi:hypothetical protein
MFITGQLEDDDMSEISLQRSHGYDVLHCVKIITERMALRALL